MSASHPHDSASSPEVPTWAPPQPFDLSLDLFLAGPGGREIEIDPIFGQTFDEIRRDYAPHTLTSGPLVDSVVASRYRFRMVETGSDSGIVLISPTGGIIGAYLGCALAIVPEHQGLGLGAELVFEFAFAFGELPTWFLDTPAYSPAGFAAHRRAWHLGRSSEFVAAKGLEDR